MITLAIHLANLEAIIQEKYKRVDQSRRQQRSTDRDLAHIATLAVCRDLLHDAIDKLPPSAPVPPKIYPPAPEVEYRKRGRPRRI